MNNNYKYFHLFKKHSFPERMADRAVINESEVLHVSLFQVSMFYAIRCFKIK